MLDLGNVEKIKGALVVFSEETTEKSVSENL